MTVRLGSRDAVADARSSAQPLRHEVAGGGSFSPAPVRASAGTFGSRFWALSSEFGDSDDEIWESEELTGAVAGDRSARSPPSARVLGDFLGLDQGVLIRQGRPLQHRSSSRSRSRSPELRRASPSFGLSDFPPLPVAKGGAFGSVSPEPTPFKLQVGSWSFEVPAASSSPVVLGAPPPLFPDLVAV
jgi:hypothetical protein